MVVYDPNAPSGHGPYSFMGDHMHGIIPELEDLACKNLKIEWHHGIIFLLGV